MFHRLIPPVYFGGLPSGFDYLNTPSLSGGTGVPAYMDGKKIGGPNDGTYAVAFGEDATSNFANRGIKAVAENTDAIDDLLRRSLAISARTADSSVGHGGLAYIAIAGQVFVGSLGTPNTQDQRDQLISVLDENDEEILDSTGTKIVAAAIVDNIISSTNLVGTQASGFYDTPTIVFNVPLPYNQTYRIYYGERSNLAELPQDAFTTIKIRGAQEVSAGIERVLLNLHSAAAYKWDDPWDTTIAALAHRGLDGTYHLDTSESALPYNTPSGNNITRDGGALTMTAPGYDLSTYGQIGVSHYPDPILASYRVASFRQTKASDYNQSYGGDVGLYQESPWHSTYDVDEYSDDRVAGPLALDVAPRAIRDPTLAGNPVITKITTNTVATLNPDAGTSSTDRCTIQVGTGDFLRDGDGNQSIRYTDLIEVTDFATGTIIGVFRVLNILSTTRLTIRALSGAIPTLATSGVASPVLLRWLQPTLQLGGRYRDAVDTSQGFPYFTVAAPSPAVTPYSANRGQLNALFLSAITDRTQSSQQFVAMAWGGFSSDGTWSARGRLDGDGGISADGGRQSFNLVGHRACSFIVNEGGRTVTWNPYVNGGGHIQIYTNGGLTTPSPIEFVIGTSSGYVPTVGDEFDLFILISTGTQSGVLSMTWPADFNFSGLDGTIPDSYMPGGPSSPTIGVHYKFSYVSTPHATGWYATRTDF